jgi:hypothetical protein
MLPPTLEQWLAQEPKAKLIPNNCVFSANYVYEEMFNTDDEMFD